MQLYTYVLFNCKWSCIPRVRGELAEDKGTSFGLQGGYAINHQGSGPGRHGSRGVYLPWLSYPFINRKHLWHQPPKCHHSCCHAELRKSDLEVTACHLNKVRTAGWYLRRTHPRSMHSTSGVCVWHCMLLGIKYIHTYKWKIKVTLSQYCCRGTVQNYC